MRIKIGKAIDNDCIVNDPLVSRQHAVLFTTDKGEYILEDLDSANGTFVNGQQILRKKVNADDVIRFGDDYESSLSEILKSKLDYSTEFDKLKEVYELYQSKKTKIQSSNQFKTRLLQSLPFALPGVVGICLSLANIANDNILYISLGFTIVAPVCGIILGAQQAAKTPGQLQVLSDQFKTDYVCPHCKTFLGEIPWQSLKNRTKCPNPACNAKW